MTKPKYLMIPCICATDLPPEVEEWFMEHDYSTHYQNEVVDVYESDHVFAKWLNDIVGIDTTKADKETVLVAVIAT